MPTTPGRGRVAVPALLSGVGLALSFPPWGFWIIAFPAAGLLWWRLGGLRPRTRLWAGWLAGLGCYVPGLMWARSFTLVGAAVLIARGSGVRGGGLPGRARLAYRSPGRWRSPPP
jgi:apolipoprotein N-acyltransferase